MDAEKLKAEFEGKKEKYLKLKDEVVFTLQKELSKEGIPFHEITGRVKEFGSFLNKIDRLDSKKPFEDIVDICGVRVICLFLGDLKRICNIIESHFKIKQKDDKVFSESDAFGYLSVHYVGIFPEAFTGPRYDELKGYQFEVQVRTIAMHAWATVSHYIDYKSPLAIPSDLRKDFNALSAMFYVADTHFEKFFRSSEEAKLVAEKKANTPQMEEEEINYNTLRAYLSLKYPNRSHVGKAEGLSELIEEMQMCGYKTIKQLDEALDRSEKAFETFEKDTKRKGDEDKRFWDLALVRISLTIVNEDYLKKKLPEGGQREARKKYRRLIKQ